MKNIKNYFNDYKHGNKLKLKLKFIISSLISIINFIISIIILHTYTISNRIIYQIIINIFMIFSFIFIIVTYKYLLLYFDYIDDIYDKYKILLEKIKPNLNNILNKISYSSNTNILDNYKEISDLVYDNILNIIRGENRKFIYDFAEYLKKEINIYITNYLIKGE